MKGSSDLQCILETLRELKDRRITGIDLSGCELSRQDANRLGDCISGEKKCQDISGSKY